MADIRGRGRVASSARQSGVEEMGRHRSALGLLEAGAEGGPAAPAIHYFDATLSYGELDRMAATLSASLTELGLAPGDRVALYLQNVPQFVIAQCAVWKAGGVVVPLNPMLKEAELSYHLNDAGARVLICLESLYERTARSVVPQTSVERVVTTSELDCVPPGSPLPPLLAESKKLRIEEALRLTERWRATFTVGAITVFIAMANHPDGARRNLTSLRKVYSGGAPVSPAVVHRFREVTGAYIHNIYGMTETTSPSHAVPLGVEAPVDPTTGALAVGVPVPGAEARIVDLGSGTREMGPEEVGEIVIRGPMVVAGYWGKPEETANAIRQGWLHTGDVGKRDASGWFYLVDRKKDLIVASGYKVWPREVEDVLYEHPAVREAAVRRISDPYRGETVKAFVALKGGWEGTVTATDLIGFCRERLAAYKYPREVEIVDEVPKTPSGKFLRRALRREPPGPDPSRS